MLEAYPESEAAALGLPNKVAAHGLPPSAASSRLGRRLEAEARGGWGGGGRGRGGGRGGGGRGGGGRRGGGKGGGGKGGGGKGGGGKGGGGKGGGGKGGGGRGGDSPPAWFARAARWARGGAKRSFLLFDQTLINAALLSAVLGQPAWPQHAEDEIRPCSSSSSSASCLPKDVAWATTQWQTSAAAAAPASLAHPPWPAGLGRQRGGARRPSATLYGDEAAVPNNNGPNTNGPNTNGPMAPVPMVHYQCANTDAHTNGPMPIAQCQCAQYQCMHRCVSSSCATRGPALHLTRRAAAPRCRQSASPRRPPGFSLRSPTSTR